MTASTSTPNAADQLGPVPSGWTYDEVCQFLYKASNPILMPLRRVIPAWRRLDIAGVVLAWALLLLKRVLIFAMMPVMPSFAGLVVIAFADLISFVLMLMLILILVRVILPARDLKLGVVTALIGAPFFLHLIYRTRREEP